MATFRPTEEQERVRSKVRRMYNQGQRLVGEWCGKIPELTMRKWGKWERSVGFLDWWSDLFPEHGLVTIADLRALEFEANKALMANLAEGDMQAVSMVLKMVSLASNRSDQAAEDSLDEWFIVDPGNNGWIDEAEA